MDINVTKTKVTIDKGNIVNKGEYNIRDCNFTLSEEYDGLVCKALFTVEKTNKTYEQPIVNNKCTIPYEVTVEKSAITLGVIGYEIEDDELIKRYSPLPYHFTIEDGSYIEDIENQSTPTPTEIEQLEQRVSQVEIDAGQVEINTQDISNIKQEQTTQNNDILLRSLITETGSQIELSLNSSNFKMTATLKDKNGNVVDTSNEIDLPLESVVVNASYDSTAKEIVLTLQNGTTVRVSIADLVSGLVSDTDYATASKGGVIKVNDYYGFDNANGVLKGISDTYQRYNSYYPNNSVISKGTLENVITGKQLINKTQFDESQATQDIAIQTLQAENTKLKEQIAQDRATYPTTTGSEKNITLSKTAEMEFIQPPLPRGNSEQDGEPSPTNEVPINNVTGDVEVLVQNKNEANFEIVNTQFRVTTEKINANSFKVTTTDNWGYAQIEMNLKANKKYTIWYKNEYSNSQLAAWKNYNGNGVYASSIAPNVPTVITTTQEKLILGLYMYTLNSSSTFEIMILEGEYTSSNIPAYTPHKEQTLPLTLGDIELCKIGDVQDYFYKENSKWYLYKAISKVILDENTGITTATTDSFKVPYNISNMIKPPISNSVALNCFCNYLHSIVWNISWSELKGFISMNINNDLRIRIDENMTLAELNTWLVEHNLILYFILATPTTTEITDTTLINQLEAISQAISYEEQTNISGSSDESNPLFSVEAYQSLKLVLAG